MSLSGPPGGVSFVDIIDIAAGVYWPIFIALALRSGDIRFGPAAPKITRAARPGAYWSILAFLALVTVMLWLLVASRFIAGLQG